MRALLSTVFSGKNIIWHTTRAPTTTDAGSSISFASFLGVKRQETLLGALWSITRVRTLQETSFQSRLAERDKRAELSATCRRKTLSDRIANDDIGRRRVSLKGSFTTTESSECCLSTPCSWNQTHRPFHVARQLPETTVIHALETPPQPLATLETPPSVEYVHAGLLASCSLGEDASTTGAVVVVMMMMTLGGAVLSDALRN